MADAREHGQAVLAAIIPGRMDLLDVAFKHLTEEHFPDPVQQNIFRLLHRYAGATNAVLPMKHLDDLISRKKDNSSFVILRESYQALTEQKTSDSDFNWSITQLREHYAESMTEQALVEARELLKSADPEETGMSRHEAARQHLQEAMVAIERGMQMAASPEGMLNEEQDELIDDYAERKKARESGKTSAIRFGIEELDRKTGGMQPGELVMSAAYSGEGKAQPLSSNVLTPSGFIRMGEVSPGTTVVTPSGRTSKVTGIFPQGVKPIFRLTWSDGSSVEATEDHLWAVDVTRHRKGAGRQGAWQEREVLTTRQLQELRSLVTKPTLPTMEAVEFAPLPTALPLDPYALGVILGDGYIAPNGAVRMSSADQELLDELQSTLPDGVSLQKIEGGKYDYRLNGTHKHFGVLRGTMPALMTSMGLNGKRAHEKVIPSYYLYATVEERQSILQGLLDTDGWVETGKGTARISTASSEMADQIVWLARSLGLRASLTTKARYATKDGVRKQGRAAFQVSLGYAPWLFRLERKRVLLRDPKNARRRALMSVEYVRDEEAQCIMIDDSEHLYVTDDFIPTHNTTLTIQASWSAAVEQGKNVVFFSTETVREQIRRKIIARHSRLEKFGLPQGLNTRDLKNGTLSPEEEEIYQKVVEDFTTNPAYGRIYIVQVPRSASITSLDHQLRRLQNIFHIDFVVMDYLALLTPERSRTSTREELANILKEAKKVATSFDNGRGVPFLSPWQVSRAARDDAERIGSYTSRALSETAEATNSADMIVSLLAPLDNSDRIAMLTMQVLKNRDGETAQSIMVEVDYANAYFRSRTGVSLGDSASSVLSL